MFTPCQPLEVTPLWIVMKIADSYFRHKTTNRYHRFGNSGADSGTFSIVNSNQLLCIRSADGFQKPHHRQAVYCWSLKNFYGRQPIKPKKTDAITYCHNDGKFGT